VDGGCVDGRSDEVFVNLKQVLWGFLLSVAFYTNFVFAETVVNSSRSFIQELQLLAAESATTQGQLSASVKRRLETLADRIDYENLGAVSLAPRWKKLSTTQKNEIKSALQELLEKVVYPQAGKIQAHVDALKFEDLGQNRVKIAGTVVRQRLGETLERPFEVELRFAANGKIKDAVLAGEVLSQSLSRQFRQALQKHDVSWIVERLRSRARQP
jgi:ABC-type transporter MlaC component